MGMRLPGGRAERGKAGPDFAGHRRHVLVLPDANNRPTQLLQSVVGVTISLNIRLQLCAPPFAVRGRPRSMHRAAVPKAPVHKDGQSRRCKDDVCPAADLWLDAAINPIPQTHAVQLAPERQLGSGVSSSLALHAPKDIWRRCRRNRHYTFAKVVSYSFAMRTIMLP